MIKEKLKDCGIVAVIRAKDHIEAETFVKSILEGGINAIELTFTIPNMPELLKKLKSKYKEGIFGAGSVLNEEMAVKAIESGAEYVVSPGYLESVDKVCKNHGILFIPGCMTLSEMLKAMENGNSLVKLFPGNVYGPNFVKSVKAPIPNIEIMPTGGVDVFNIKEWFKCGVSLVGVGSSLLSSNDPEKIKSLAKEFIKKLNEYREENI